MEMFETISIIIICIALIVAAVCIIYQMRKNYQSPNKRLEWYYNEFIEEYHWDEHLKENEKKMYMYFSSAFAKYAIKLEKISLLLYGVMIVVISVFLIIPIMILWGMFL